MLQLYEQLQASEAFALQQTDRVRLLEAEQEKSRLVLSVATGKRKLADLENTILRLHLKDYNLF